MRLLFYCALLSCCSSCYMVRAYKNRKLDLSSHSRLPSQQLVKSTAPFHFAIQTATTDTALKTYLDKNLPGTGTAALLIVRNDSIVYENYFNGFTQTSLLPSFSVVKSFVATLVGICYEEEKIKSLQEPFTNYLPRFLKKDKRFAQITIQQLLDMRSGLQWEEGEYGLKDDAIKMAFRPNITPYVYKVKIKEPPGRLVYQSINTLLLAMVVEKATGQSISAYLQQKIWQPLGMEQDATWSSDKHKREIAYAGLNATARDFAKFGRLYLNKGKWQDKQLISAAWIDSTTGAVSMFRGEGYKNQFWGNTSYREFADSATAVEAGKVLAGTGVELQSYKLITGEKRFYIAYPSPAYYALGILGQYIYINPENNSIIVRLGYHWSHAQLSLNDFIRQLSEEL